MPILLQSSHLHCRPWLPQHHQHNGANLLLRTHYGPSPLLRLAPSLYPALVLWRSWGLHLRFPSHRDDRFPRSMQEPVLCSCCLYAGCRPASNQITAGLITHRVECAFLTSFCSFRQFTFVHLRNTYLTLTTTALNGSSSRRFENCVWTPPPGAEGSPQNYC